MRCGADSSPISNDKKSPRSRGNGTRGKGREREMHDERVRVIHARCRDDKFCDPGHCVGGREEGWILV